MNDEAIKNLQRGKWTITTTAPKYSTGKVIYTSGTTDYCKARNSEGRFVVLPPATKPDGKP